MEFKLTELGHDHFAFRNDKNGATLAEITWTQMADVMVVEHTFVDPSLRGQGIAKNLLDRTAEYARENQYRIEPVCSYVVTAFERSNEYDDLKV